MTPASGTLEHVEATRASSNLMTSPPSDRPAVLVVEDEARIRELVSLHLQLEGLAPTEAIDGDGGLALARSRKFDLIILDLMLPGLDGVTICRAVRRDSPNADTPILMLTARRDESDKVLGLDSGADDYLTKPFGIRELLARVRALLRRGHSAQTRPSTGASAGPIVYKHIEIDPARRRVRVGADEVDLTFNEFELLYVLVSNPGIVFSREALLSKVWKDQTFVTVRSVDTLVKRLRKKIERDPSEPAVILTVWGAGYKGADV
ncbi:MAG TPA: response regulator transcription factor [Vicinamibacterales bacterium]|nr:response regulator transcription factor [Vicinamibacterales bacterium]